MKTRGVERMECPRDVRFTVYLSMARGFYQDLEEEEVNEERVPHYLESGNYSVQLQVFIGVLGGDVGRDERCSLDGEGGVLQNMATESGQLNKCKVVKLKVQIARQRWTTPDMVRRSQNEE